MLGKRHSGMHCWPLNPRLEVRLLLASVGRVDRGRFVKPAEMRNNSRRHEPLEQRRAKLVELDQDQPRGEHTSSLLAEEVGQSGERGERTAQSAGRPKSMRRQ